ncbi:hypothetical protein A6U97_12120 [Agrobacterium tumefaciens]|uniref:regulatory protein GemA n=1 Tax=Agrobacterium tumefaciens TaxID=358 RepID=UPI0008101343|nr:hypothetical protein A6U97_12120 [Agrobacterium tumefaciens]
MSMLNRAIFGGFRQLGITEEDAQRAIYDRVTGKARLSRMTAEQQNAVLEELRRLGYRPKETASPRPTFRSDGRDGKHKLSGKYLPKLRALWIACYNLGVIDDRRDSALDAFVIGRQLPHLSDIRFVHQPSDAAGAIEAMKGMLTRAGVDLSDHPRCELYEKSHGYKIARAQWAIIHPRQPAAFWRAVTDLINENISHRNLSDADWITVMNHLGPQVRRVKKAAEK